MKARIDQTMERQFGEAQRKHSQNDILGALRIYDSLVSKGLATASLLVYRALAQVQLGREAEAKYSAQRAMESLGDMANKNEVATRSTLGVVFRRLAMPEQAERQLRLALEADPGNAVVRNNLALVLTQLGRYDQADTLFAEAMEELHEDAAPALNRARIALRRQDYEQAEAMLRHAKDCQPGHEDVALLEAQLALAESDGYRTFSCLMRVFAKNPVHQEAWNYLGAVQAGGVKAEDLEKALAALVRAKPTSAKLLATAVSLARKHLCWKHLEELEALLNAALEGDSDALIDVGSMFLLLSSNVSQKAHRVSAHRGFEAFIGRGKNTPRPEAAPRAGRKLRVGYLSSDLRGHAIGFLFAGVMEAHRHENMEWFAYMNWKDDGSDMRQRYRKAFDRVVNITELSDAETAQRMREDGIDVLVDLNQMTAGNRVGVFSYGPAPVTVQWLGMPGTIGAGERVDYVLLDSWTGHPGNLDGFDEQPVILAGSYQPNDWQKPDMALAKDRQHWHLPAEAPVLCSFNQTQKFSPDTVALWADILHQVPEAVLWVLAGESAIEERFVRIFTAAGIARERILFAERAGHDVHVARIAHADIMLDNWPYNAHTTCSDALRAGTPVITLPGRTFASRVAAGILDTAGLGDWIADSPQAYVDKAVAHIRQSFAQRQTVKEQISTAYWASPMVDCAAFAQRLEAFYEAAFALALQGENPAPHWVDMAAQVHRGLPPEDQWHAALRGLVTENSAGTAASCHQDVAVQGSSSSAASPASAPSPSCPSGASLPQAAATTSAMGATSATGTHTYALWDIRKGTREARWHNQRLLWQQVLGQTQTPLCVDVGAAPNDRKIWDVLAAQGMVRLVGFEPQADENAKANKGPDRSRGQNQDQGKQDIQRHCVQAALGDGQSHTLHVAEAPGMSSLLEADMDWLARFPLFAQWSEEKSRQDLPTRRADDVAEIAGARFMKIDTQGSEKLILEHATRLLDEELVLLEMELSPTPLYKQEPSLFDVGQWLGQRGWMLHHFSHVDRRMLKPLGEDDNPYDSYKQIFQVDAVFLPHVDRWKDFSADRLQALAYLAHTLYGSFDVATLALHCLDANEAGKSYEERYRRYLQEAGMDA